MQLLGNREPVAIAAAIRLSLVAAIAFGLDLTDIQLVSLMAAVEAIMGLVLRGNVASPATVKTVTGTTDLAQIPVAAASGTTGTGDGKSSAINK